MQSNRLMLIIAVAAGITATVLAFSYLRSATGGQEAEPTTSILFAVDDLPANHVIDPDSDLRADSVGTMSSSGLVYAAVKADEREATRGRRTNRPVPAGSPLLYSELTAIEDIHISPGSRAMGISVSAESMLGGMLVPGDHVDILVTFPSPAEAQPTPPEVDLSNPQVALGAAFAEAFAQPTDPSRWEVREVLANVRVIAIGAELQRSRQQMLFGLGAGGPISGVVTIEVTPEQALDLVRATAGGANQLTLLLRPPATQKGGAGAGEGGTIEEEP
jgi:Flp pilus assembly protein CpaB